MSGMGLVTIKRRIKSINNTKKITRAIGLVSTSKLRKIRKKLEVNNYYYNALNEIMKSILSDKELLSDDNIKQNIFFSGNDSPKKLYIVFVSDSGLCGGFNVNIINKAMEYVLKDRENSLLITVGKKGRIYLKRFKLKSVAEYVDIPDIPTLKDAKTILNKALELYLKGEVGEINIVYAEFVSAVKQEPKLKKLLPLSSNNTEVDENEKNFREYEPDKEEILRNISELYLKQTIFNLMMNSKTSEQLSRMTAMTGAAKNSDEILDKLNLQYNRIRQSNITQEISEIVGGSQAQK